MKRIQHLAVALLLFLLPAAAMAGESHLVAQLKAGKSQVVVTYGTSLTAGGAWVSDLEKTLQANWPGLVTVSNSGEGGMWSKWGAENLDARVIAKKPDTVLIEFAINDAYLPYATSVEAAKANLNTMIDRILAAKAETEIVLMTMNPPTAGHLEKRPAYQDYYGMYREVARTRSLTLIDHNAAWEPVLKSDAARFTRYVPDGIHPGPEGCREVILPGIIKALGIPAKPAPERLALWPGPAPEGEGKFSAENAHITVYRPARPNGAGLVICPGGGYGGLAIDGEGHGIAEWLNRHGITGVVLEYRLPQGRRLVPLLDAQRAIRLVRANAAAWGCDPARLGIIGFSAGGHLASTAATHFDKGEPAAADAVDRQSSRPDFSILVYPVITMEEQTHGGSKQNLLGANPSAEVTALFSSEKQVTGQTPPVFLTHAVNDKVVTAENSRMFYAALQAKKVPSEYLELPSGDHGLNGYQGPMWDAWQSSSMKWLASLKLIPSGDAGEPR